MIASSDVIHTVGITIYLVEELTMNVEIRVAGCLPSTANRLEGTPWVPIVATDEDSVPSKVTTGEPPIIVIEGAIVIDKFGEVGDNSFVESDSVMASWRANEIAFEAMQACEELFPDDGLGLNVAERFQKGSGDTGQKHHNLDQDSNPYLFAISCTTRSRCWIMWLS